MLTNVNEKKIIFAALATGVSIVCLWKLLSQKKKKEVIVTETNQIKLEKDDTYKKLIQSLKQILQAEKILGQISKNTTMQINKVIYYLLRTNFTVAYQQNKQARQNQLYDFKRYGELLFQMLSNVKQNLNQAQEEVLKDLQLEQDLYEESKQKLESQNSQYHQNQEELFLILQIEYVPNPQQINKKTFIEILDYKIQEFKKIKINKVKNYFNMNQINQIVYFYLDDLVQKKFGYEHFNFEVQRSNSQDIEVLNKQKELQNLIQTTLIDNCQFPY